MRSIWFSPKVLMSDKKKDGSAEESRSRLPFYFLVSFMTMISLALLGINLGWVNNLQNYSMPIANDGLPSPELYVVLRMFAVGISLITTPHSIAIHLMGPKERDVDVEMNIVISGLSEQGLEHSDDCT